MVTQAQAHLDQLAALNDDAPRLVDYATPQKWYSAVTEWMIVEGLKVQKLPEAAPVPASPHPRNNLWSHFVGRAAYILGCMALEGNLIIDIDKQESRDEFGYAVRVIALALENTEPARHGDMPMLRGD